MSARALVLATLCAAACTLPTPREGVRCVATSDCGDDELECVDVDGDGACLPVIEREATTCGDDADCDGALFPVEAECDQGLCRCADRECDEDDVFDAALCRCIASEDEAADACAVDEHCRDGLNCIGGTCRRGIAPGDRCAFDEPCDANDLGCFCGPGESECSTGTCLGREGRTCSRRADCSGEAPNCVENECSAEPGSLGQGCTDDDDCDSFDASSCDANVCQ